jgi:hypothetical protein
MQDQSEPNSIRAIGYVAGKIDQIGPDYASLIRSPEAIHDWIECWDEVYHLHQDLQQLRAMNEEYMFRILRYTEEDLARIRHIKNQSAVGWFVSEGRQGPDISALEHVTVYGNIWNSRGDDAEANRSPRICIGTNHLMALVPPEASAGDVIIRFWNCGAAIVMRPSTAKAGDLLMIGRADVARIIDHNFQEGVDSYASESLLYSQPHRSTLYKMECPSLGAVYVELDFPTLQIISASIDAQGQAPGRDIYTGFS